LTPCLLPEARAVASPIMLSDSIAHVAAFRQHVHVFMLVSVIVAAHVQNHVHFIMAMYCRACGMTTLCLLFLSVARYGHVWPCL